MNQHNLKASKEQMLYISICLILIGVLVVSILLAVTIGSVNISVREVYRVIIHKMFGIGEAEIYGGGAIHDVVWLIRLPRLMLAVIVGIGLSVCGVNLLNQCL